MTQKPVFSNIYAGKWAEIENGWLPWQLTFKLRNILPVSVW